jgi:putative heme transporter
MVTQADGSTATDPAPGLAPRRRVSVKQLIWFAVGLVIVVGIFVFAIPTFADYGDVWAAMRTLTPIETATLVALTLLNLVTYWLANRAALPGLRLGQAAVVTQTTTSVANTLPAGGAVAIGLTYAILSSWGFSGGETALYVGVTGIWNIFTKLALPVVALGVLVLTGRTYPTLVGAAAVGLMVLLAAVVLLALVFKSEPMARKVGELVGRVLSAVRRLLRRPPRTGLGDGAVRFRRETIVLVRRRWFQLTWTTLLSHLVLFVILLLSLRSMGVSEQDISASEAFAIFAFGRLLTAIPITPGGVGVIDLGYVAGLASFAPGEKAEIVAAVLIFRTLTFGIQIPIGAFTYVIWRVKSSWRRDTPPPGSIAGEIAAASVAS